MHSLANTAAGLYDIFYVCLGICVLPNKIITDLLQLRRFKRSTSWFSWTDSAADLQRQWTCPNMRVSLLKLWFAIGFDRRRMDKLALLGNSWTRIAYAYRSHFVPRFLPWIQGAINALVAEKPDLKGVIFVPGCGTGNCLLLFLDHIISVETLMIIFVTCKLFCIK